jgi:putative ABC transport system permease protein
MMGSERTASGEQRTVPDRRSVNRSMFWRVLRRSVFANRARLLVILLALGAGAAITAALLNLQVDAKRRITAEFRSFGANITIVPRNGERGNTMPESVSNVIPISTPLGPISRIALLPVVAEITPVKFDRETQPVDVSDLGKALPAVVNGETSTRQDFDEVYPSKTVFAAKTVHLDFNDCSLGKRLAEKLGVNSYQPLRIKVGQSFDYCLVSRIREFGSALDEQAFVDLALIHRLTNTFGQIGLIQLRIPGTPEQVAETVSTLQRKLKDAEVRPIRQFTEGEARLYGKISGVLTATVAVVLVLTALCVMAAMTNIAAERKNDVGLMKAIGGSVRRVLRIFLAEAALLGLAAGLLGAAAGMALSIGLGKAVFGVAAQPRLIVYPVSVALIVIVAILAAYPLRRLVHIRPASVFRGEE